MKKIISNKVYNTETAKLVGTWDNNYGVRDFNYCSEELYRKKNGEFFLHGEGNALSKYAQRYTDGMGYGEKIIPLTYDQAQRWAEDKLDGDEYEEIFGEITEDEKLSHIHISLPADQAAIIKRNAQQEGLTVSAYIALKCTE